MAAVRATELRCRETFMRVLQMHGPGPSFELPVSGSEGVVDTCRPGSGEVPKAVLGTESDEAAARHA